MRVQDSRRTQPERYLRDLFHGAVAARVVSVGAALGVPDLVARGVDTISELAAATGTNERALARFLRALVALEVLDLQPDGSFGLAPAGRLLTSDGRRSVRPLALFTAARWRWRAWASLDRALTTGRSAFEEEFGARLFEYLTLQPPEAEALQDHLAGAAQLRNRALAATYPFPPDGTVCDVGGGMGGALSAILAEHPGVRGVLIEQPLVAEMARRRLREAGLGHRCGVVAGDFFQEVPRGADIYLLMSVLHDWPDDDARWLLARCRATMRDTARLLVVEQPLDDETPNEASTLLDLEMLVLTGGRERTVQEYTDLLTSASFCVTRSLSLAPVTPAVVLEARPV